MSLFELCKYKYLDWSYVNIFIAGHPGEPYMYELC